MSNGAREAEQYVAESHSIEELLRGDDFLSALLDALPTGVLVVDADHRVRAVNRVVEQTFGVRADEVRAKSTGDVLQEAKMTLDDVDLVIFHQANMRIIDSAVKNLGIDPAKVFNNLDRYGNTSAASIPLALDEAHREGRIRRGDRILLSGFGAGLAWGTALIRW